jgi:hypothetical protein
VDSTHSVIARRGGDPAARRHDTDHSFRKAATYSRLAGHAEDVFCNTWPSLCRLYILSKAPACAQLLCPISSRDGL